MRRAKRNGVGTRMRLSIVLAGVMVGSVVTLLALELVLRLLPVSMGLFRTLDYQTWPLRAYSPHEQFTYSRGWELLMVNRGRTNNYGQIAPFDYRPHSRPVIVIGDSFVAGETIAYSDTIQAQMAEFLGASVPVYGFGFNGSSISEYLAVAAQASSEFSPRAATILLVDGDITESLLPRAGHYFFAREGDSMRLQYRPLLGRSWFAGVRQSIGDIAVFKYVFSNLQFTIDELMMPQGAHSSVRATIDPAAIDAVNAFLSDFPARSGIPPSCTVFLLDADRYKIYTGRESEVKDPASLWRYFSDKARLKGFRVVELAPAFAATYASHGEKFDYWPVDRHWNRLGHRIGATLAVRELSDARGATSCLH